MAKLRPASQIWATTCFFMAHKNYFYIFKWWKNLLLYHDTWKVYETHVGVGQVWLNTARSLVDRLLAVRGFAQHVEEGRAAHKAPRVHRAGLLSPARNSWVNDPPSPVMIQFCLLIGTPDWTMIWQWIPDILEFYLQV